MSYRLGIISAKFLNIQSLDRVTIAIVISPLYFVIITIFLQTRHSELVLQKVAVCLVSCAVVNFQVQAVLIAVVVVG